MENMLRGIFVLATVIISIQCTDIHVYRKQMSDELDIPEDIPDNASIVAINNNFISRLGANSFQNLKGCKELDLDFNFISEIEPGAFSGLDNLTTLSLQNQIGLTTLKKNMFIGLDNLKYLQLARNVISKIENGTFTGLGQVVFLDLTKNRLRSINRGMFTGLESLEWLALSKNRISTTYSEFLLDLPRQGISLAIDHNPLDCDFLCWLRYEDRTGRITLVNNPTCDDIYNVDSESCFGILEEAIEEEHRPTTRPITHTPTTTTTTKAPDYNMYDELYNEWSKESESGEDEEVNDDQTVEPPGSEKHAEDTGYWVNKTTNVTDTEQEDAVSDVELDFAGNDTNETNEETTDKPYGEMYDEDMYEEWYGEEVNETNNEMNEVTTDKPTEKPLYKDWYDEEGDGMYEDEKDSNENEEEPKGEPSQYGYDWYDDASSEMSDEAENETDIKTIYVKPSYVENDGFIPEEPTTDEQYVTNDPMWLERDAYEYDDDSNYEQYNRKNEPANNQDRRAYDYYDDHAYQTRKPASQVEEYEDGLDRDLALVLGVTIGGTLVTLAAVAVYIKWEDILSCLRRICRRKTEDKKSLMEEDVLDKEAETNGIYSTYEKNVV